MPASVASTAVIQGAGGSLGTHFARHLLSRSKLNVVATSRNPDETKRTILEGGGLDETRLTVLKADVTEERTIEDAAAQVKERFGGASLKLLLNVSGVLHADKSIQQVKMDELLHTFQLNTFGHMLTYKHFVPLLPKTADMRKAKEANAEDLSQGFLPSDLSVCASLTARVGSIGDNGKGGWIGYRASKSATNQVVVTLQRELELRSTPSIAVALHPGTVVGTNLSEKWTKKEDAGKKPGVFVAEDSTAKLLEVIKGLKKEDGGRFLDWAGKDIVW